MHNAPAAPPPPLSAISPRHWMVVAGAGLLMALNVLVFLAVGLLMPRLAESLGVGLGQAMVFVSINMVAGAAVLTIAGPMLMRRLTARWLGLLGAVVTGVSLFAVAYVTDLVGLYVLAFTSGALATVAMQMTGAALVNDWFLERRGLMQGLLMGVAGLGGLVAGGVLPGVVAAGGWQLGFQAVGAGAVVVGLVSTLVLIRSRPADVGLHVYGSHDEGEEAYKDATGVPARAAVRTPQFVALMVALVSLPAIMALQQHFPSMMADRGLDLAAAGSLLSLLSVVNVGTTLLLGNLSDRYGALAAYLLSSVLLLPALAMFLLTQGYGAQLAAVLLFSIPGITPPILTPILLRAAFGGRAFVPLLGIATASMPAGIALGSPLWGLTKDVTGSYDLALGVAIGLVVVNAVLVTFALRTAPRMWRPAPADAPQEPAGR